MRTEQRLLITCIVGLCLADRPRVTPGDTPIAILSQEQMRRVVGGQDAAWHFGCYLNTGADVIVGPNPFTEPYTDAVDLGCFVEQSVHYGYTTVAYIANGLRHGFGSLWNMMLQYQFSFVNLHHNFSCANGYQGGDGSCGNMNTYYSYVNADVNNSYCSGTNCACDHGGHCDSGYCDFNGQCSWS